ncbi:hypothetical protein J6500_30550 [Bradyrhizobium sp. WSM 1704]|nr:hypothetical protein [Bradyrhizobium semiaridum]
MLRLFGAEVNAPQSFRDGAQHQTRNDAQGLRRHFHGFAAREATRCALGFASVAENPAFKSVETVRCSKELVTPDISHHDTRGL